MSCDTLTFYNQVWCPKSQSIHLALEANEVPHKTVTINDDNEDPVWSEKESAILTIEDKGRRSSGDYKEIVAFLNLTSEDPAIRSKQERILEHFVNYILPYFEKSVILKSPREGLDLFLEALSFLENEILYSGGDYFGGNQPNIIDYGLFPYLDKIGKWTPDFDPSECSRLQNWIKVMRQHPLVVKIMSNKSECEHLENYLASLRARQSDCS